MDRSEGGKARWLRLAQRGRLRWWMVMREERYCSTPGTTIEATDQALASSTEKVDEAAFRRALDCRFWAPKCQWAAGITQEMDDGGGRRGRVESQAGTGRAKFCRHITLPHQPASRLSPATSPTPNLRIFDRNI